MREIYNAIRTLIHRFELVKMIDDKKIGQVLVRPASVVANVLDLKNKHLSENEQWHCNNCGS